MFLRSGQAARPGARFLVSRVNRFRVIPQSQRTAKAAQIALQAASGQWPDPSPGINRPQDGLSPGSASHLLYSGFLQVPLAVRNPCLRLVVILAHYDESKSVLPQGTSTPKARAHAGRTRANQRELPQPASRAIAIRLLATFGPISS